MRRCHARRPRTDEGGGRPGWVASQDGWRHSSGAYLKILAQSTTACPVESPRRTSRRADMQRDLTLKQMDKSMPDTHEPSRIWKLGKQQEDEIKNYKEDEEHKI